MTTAPPTQYFEPKTPLPTKLSEMNFDDSTFAESPAIVRSPKLENTGTPVNNEKSHQIEDLSTDSYNFDTGWNDLRAKHKSLKIKARIFTIFTNFRKIFFSHFFNPKFADKTGPSTTDSPNRSLFDKTCESPKITNLQQVLESITNSGSEDEIEPDHEPDQDENIFNWDGVNMELNASFKDTQAVRCCRFSPDGQRYDFKDKKCYLPRCRKRFLSLF